MTHTPTLHLFCGKIASGKSTLAARLAAAPATVLISEDVWLAALFGDEMTTPRDFMCFSRKLRAIMGPHVTALLDAGLSVVLDFQANTPEARAWMRLILDTTTAEHRLHLLDAPDALCLARLRARNASGGHPFATTEAQFNAVTRHFVPPAPDEGFNIIRHPQA